MKQAKKQLNIRLTSGRKLSKTQIDQMCKVYLKHHHVSKAACIERLRTGFDKIVLYEDQQTGQIIGFNGLITTLSWQKGFIRPVYGLYLGQLIIDPSYRACQPVQKALLKILTPRLFFQPWTKPIIWADALTFKVYLLIAQNNREFYPHPKRETPVSFKQFMDKKGLARFGDRYDPATGCISNAKKVIMDHVAPIHRRLLAHRYIRFYAEQNPGYASGNGLLVCTPWSWQTSWGILQKTYPFLRYLSSGIKNLCSTLQQLCRPQVHATPKPASMS